MARAGTKTRKPRLTRADLREDIIRGLAPLPQGQARVDREKKIIYGVKVLGRDSQNGRRYTPEAVQDAYQRRLYEGIAVYTDHPQKPGDPRPVRNKLGRIVNVRVMEGELFGDLEYLESNADTPLIVETAERMAEQMGLSHNAQGDVEEGPDGITIVNRIVEVRSVDVVTEPATTGGFFEQKGGKMKRKEYFAKWIFPKVKATQVNLQKRIKQLMEEDYMAGDMEDATEPADDAEALKGGFRSAVAAAVDRCLDGEEDPAECVKRIKELLTGHAKLSADDGEDMEEEEKEEPKEPKEEEKAKKEEEQEQRIRKIERENLINREARKAGVVVDDDLMESLLAVSDDGAIKKLIAREKGKGSGRTNAPRSGTTGGSETKTTLEGVETPEGFMAALLG